MNKLILGLCLCLFSSINSKVPTKPAPFIEQISQYRRVKITFQDQGQKKSEAQSSNIVSKDRVRYGERGEIEQEIKKVQTKIKQYILNNEKLILQNMDLNETISEKEEEKQKLKQKQNEEKLQKLKNKIKWKIQDIDKQIAKLTEIRSSKNISIYQTSQKISALYAEKNTFNYSLQQLSNKTDKFNIFIYIKQNYDKVIILNQLIIQQLYPFALPSPTPQKFVLQAKIIMDNKIYPFSPIFLPDCFKPFGAQQVVITGEVVNKNNNSLYIRSKDGLKTVYVDKCTTLNSNQKKLEMDQVNEGIIKGYLTKQGIFKAILVTIIS